MIVYYLSKLFSITEMAWLKPKCLLNVFVSTIQLNICEIYYNGKLIFFFIFKVPVELSINFL